MDAWNLCVRVCVVSNTYDAVFDAHASPASAHSASSASRLEYDGVGTDEVLLFDLRTHRKKRIENFEFTIRWNGTLNAKTYAFGVACFDDSQPSAACSHSASSSSIDFWCVDDDRLFDDGWLECLD